MVEGQLCDAYCVTSRIARSWRAGTERDFLDFCSALTLGDDFKFRS
jgi:hypothetical protein